MTDEQGRVIRETPLFLDVLLRLQRRGLGDDDVRFAFRLYGPVLVRVAALVLHGARGVDRTPAEAAARQAFASVLERLQGDSVDAVLRSFDEFGDRHDPYATSEALTAVFEPLDASREPGLGWLQGLLSYGEGTERIDADQRLLLEALAGHALREPGLLEQEPELHRQGAVVMREGEAATDVVVVVDGELRVEVGGTPIGRRLAGAVLGEMALLFGGARTATVVVQSRDARLLRLSAGAFRRLLTDRTFAAAWAELAARRSNHDVIGDVRERRRLDGVALEDIATDPDRLQRQRVAFETLVRRRFVQGAWAPVGPPAPDSALAHEYLDERVRLGRVLAWELGLDALAIQYAPDFAAETKVEGGRASALTRADTMGQLKLMEVVRATFPGTDTVVGEEDVGAELFADGADADYRWIVDPIDGTRAFSEGGDEWGVHVFCAFRVARDPAEPSRDRWIPLLSVKFAPTWNGYDEQRGGLMETWQLGGPIAMNGEPWSLHHRAERVRRRGGPWLCGSHPRLPFVQALPPDRFASAGRYNSGMIQSMKFDLGLLDVLSIGSPTNNRTKPHDAFATFSALGFGGSIGVFDFDRDRHGRVRAASADLLPGGLARTVVGEEAVVDAFVEGVEAWMGTAGTVPPR
jgi:hypothetical protein